MTLSRTAALITKGDILLLGEIWFRNRFLSLLSFSGCWERSLRWLPAPGQKRLCFESIAWALLPCSNQLWENNNKKLWRCVFVKKVFSLEQYVPVWLEPQICSESLAGLLDRVTSTLLSVKCCDKLLDLESKWVVVCVDRGETIKVRLVWKLVQNLVFGFLKGVAYLPPLPQCLSL